MKLPHCILLIQNCLGLGMFKPRMVNRGLKGDIKNKLQFHFKMTQIQHQKLIKQFMKKTRQWIVVWRQHNCWQWLRKLEVRYIRYMLWGHSCLNISFYPIQSRLWQLLGSRKGCNHPSTSALNKWHPKALNGQNVTYITLKFGPYGKPS